ncbi:hypothetical protein GO495_31085 [Chitinophaga oryziterrae]|uniref:Uncharacterized protein n=1 Tax=Chitinophaga oryziterrae TaxID=1031224 RepID=A0A6N8JIH6_9BACT|nr:hypothetical protein [Chitinophaga oryziterrae]
MRSSIIILVLSILSCSSYGQDVTLHYDTVNIITVEPVDNANKEILSSTRYFYIKNQYYYGANFPFRYILSECNVLVDDFLFHTNYASLVNQKSVKNLVSVTDNAKRFDIDYILSHPDHYATPELLNLIRCLKKESHQSIVVSEQRFIAAFFILECKTRRGVDSPPIFCNENTTSDHLPVFLNVVKIIK